MAIKPFSWANFRKSIMKIRNFSIFTLIILSVISFYLFRIFKNSSSRKDNSVFIIGTASGYAPFVSINERNQYEGFDIDVANAISEKLGKKLEIKDLGSMSPLFIALEQNKVDAIIWGLSITKERTNKVAMVKYQGELDRTYPLLFWKSIPEKIRSLEDINNLNNFTVCVEPGSSQENVLKKYPKINKIYTERIDDALLNLQYAKTNAALVEPTIAKKFKSKYPEIKILDIKLAPEDQVDGVGIAIKKDNIDLINNIFGIVKELKASGKLKELQSKWGL